MFEQATMKGVWREKLGCPHYHGHPEGVGGCDANEMRPCVYDTDPNPSCEIFGEVIREWKEELLSPRYPEEEVRLMLEGKLPFPKWLIKGMEVQQ